MERRSMKDRLRNIVEKINMGCYELLQDYEVIFRTKKFTDALGIQWHNPDFELKMVKHDPKHLIFMNQTPEKCLAAVENSPTILKYVHDQSFDVCMAAIEKNPSAIQYVRNPTPELCAAVAKLNPEALTLIKDRAPATIPVTSNQVHNSLDHLIAAAEGLQSNIAPNKKEPIQEKGLEL